MGAVEIIPQVYQLTIALANVILITEEELTLVDTGYRWSSTQIVSFIRSLGRSPEEISLIILTHNHRDHMGGLAELKRLTPAKVAAHRADISITEFQLAFPRSKGKRLPLSSLPVSRRLFSVKPNEVDIPLEGGEVPKPLGGLEVIHTPGHTPGSISLFSRRKKLLIVGDAMNKRYSYPRLPPKLVSTDLRQAVDSIKRLAQLDFDFLCCGHGRPLMADARARVLELIEETKMVPWQQY